MRVIVNPGAGDIPDATTRTNADANIWTFGEDLREAHRYRGVRIVAKDTPMVGGRWAYVVSCRRADVDVWEQWVVDMPGLPLEQVRYLGWPEHDPFDFTRLYVDGSSWLWKFAVQACGPE